MMKKTYIRPIVKVCTPRIRPIMNLGSFRQSSVKGDIKETEDDTEDYWGY